MVTFPVDKVSLCKNPLPVEGLQQSLGVMGLKGVEASSTHPNLVGTNTNPFVEAMHLAYAYHFPLTLSPDDVWTVIAQGFATHVNQNVEALRNQFVSHDGKATLIVRRDNFVKGSHLNDWPGCFSEFSEQISGYIGKKRDAIVSDFSTTGLVERAASEIVLMGAMQGYFAYEVHTKCGIPSITLLGTPEDWQKVRAKAEVLAEYDLGWWTTHLLPILDQFVKASEGSADARFWKNLYKLHQASGGDRISGWVTAFFPYLLERSRNGKYYKKNEFSALKDPSNPWSGPTSSSFPPSMTLAPFVWKYFDQTFKMEFAGGFVGTSQDPHTLAMRPALGWAVLTQE